MKVRIKHIEALLQALSVKTGQSQEHYGFNKMSEIIEEKINKRVSGKYLYESLYRKTQSESAKEEEYIKLQPLNLDTISKFLGLKNFNEFIDSQESPLNPVLKGCVGTYRSYLRRNTEKGIILSSPVKIYEEGKKIFLELRGPEWLYKGRVEFKNNCLFVIMRTDNGKEFHHVYQIGQKIGPKVLQGIFSGVSTSFEPIAGRVVLMKTSAPFDSIKNEGYEIEKLRQSKKIEERRIAEYFEEYSRNNLSIRRAMTYWVDDLGDCK